MNTHVWKRYVLVAAVAIMGVMSLGLAEVAQAAPYSGTVYGRTTWRGYFTNQFEDTGRVVIPPGSDNVAIPSSINSPGELEQFLRNQYNSGSAQRRTGASFIVNTMLGRDGSEASRNLSSADWTDWRERVDERQANGQVSWSGNVSGWINSYYQPNSNDDAFYREWRSEPGITFRDDDGSIVYRLIRRCANPIGDTQEGLPEVQRWQAADNSFIQEDDGAGNPEGNLGTSVNASPGERYHFNHNIVNQGPDALDRNITTWREYSYPSGSESRADEQTGGNGTPNDGTIRTIRDDTGVIPSTAGGQQWCSRAFADPRAYNSSATLTGSELCVNVPYEYELLPHVSIGGGQETNVEQGATDTRVDYRVNNEGPTQSNDTQWQLIRFVTNPDAPASSATDQAGNNNSDGCSTHTARPGVDDCEVVEDGNRVFDVGNTDIDQFTHDTGDIPVGARICFALSVSTPTQESNPSWGHSQPACIMVVKKPKIQVHGGDLWAGRQFVSDTSQREPANITTGTSTIEGQTYGSWSEYGVFATGGISGMASGAGLAGGRDQAQAAPEDISFLTFANTPAYGAYTQNPGRVPDYAGIYAESGAAAPTNIDATTAADGRFVSGGNVTISASGDIPKGKTLIVRAQNITIADSLVYEDEYSNINELPQVILIANGSISIEPDVSRVDSWLVAEDTLYTCNDPAPLTVDVCNEELVMNGPVAAGEASLRRTFGSDAEEGRDTPAELFNLRPDAFLGVYAEGASEDRARTVHQVELPPRF